MIPLNGGETSADLACMLGLPVVLVVGIGTVIGSLLADLGYAILDPRVRDQIGEA